MSESIQTLWKRLKIAALDRAVRGEYLTERQAEDLVLRVAHDVNLTEPLPPEAIAFYVHEVLTAIEQYENPGATA